MEAGCGGVWPLVLCEVEPMRRLVFFAAEGMRILGGSDYPVCSGICVDNGYRWLRWLGARMVEEANAVF